MTFQFASPWVLLLLLGVPLLAAYPFWARRTSRPAGLVYASTSLTATPGRSLRLRLSPVLPALRLLALALVIVAVARPQTVEGREIIEGQGIDIALALDISGSMASLDFQPKNRLEAAKEVIADFVAGRRYDRIGLVVFASDSFVQSPPTLDHDVVALLLGDVELSSDVNIESGTAIGLGLASAANLVKDSDAKSRIIILLTDGANNSGEIDPETAAIAANALGIKVYAIGVGRPGQVLMPLRDRFGERLVSRESELDEDALRQIAATTGGRYFRATDTEGLRQVYDEIDGLEKSQVEVRVFSRFQELAGWLVVPAILLLLLELTLRHSLLRRLP